ncbi:MAG: oligosaccharide flippase family protein [Hymenobacter sp.]
MEPASASLSGRLPPALAYPLVSDELHEIADEVTIVKDEAGMAKPTMRRFAVNVASLFSVQIANFLLPLLTVPYVVRIIGPEKLGLLNFSQAYVTYFSLLINYGFDMAAVRSIAANRDDKEATNRIFSQVMAGKTLLWVLSTVVFVIVSLSNPEFKAHLFLHVCTYLVCIGTVLSPFWLYQAMEDLGRVALFNLAVKLIFSLSVLLLIREAGDYFYQNLAISVSQILVSVGALYVAMRRFSIRFTWPSSAALRTRFREDRTLFFSSVTITIYASSNVFILGLMSLPYNVGIYSAGTRLEGMAETFVGLALNQALFPVVAQAFGQGREQGLRDGADHVFPALYSVERGGGGAVAGGAVRALAALRHQVSGCRHGAARSVRAAAHHRDERAAGHPHHDKPAHGPRLFHHHGRGLSHWIDAQLALNPAFRSHRSGLRTGAHRTVHHAGHVRLPALEGHQRGAALAPARGHRFYES